MTAAQNDVDDYGELGLGRWLVKLHLVNSVIPAGFFENPHRQTKVALSAAFTWTLLLLGCVLAAFCVLVVHSLNSVIISSETRIVSTPMKVPEATCKPLGRFRRGPGQKKVFCFFCHIYITIFFVFKVCKASSLAESLYISMPAACQ